jgi:uncharacterized damage-inducible protein DinB
MNVKDIRQLYEYNRWANARMLDVVSALTAEQFTKDLSSSFASLRETIVHILSAEWIWLKRWQGESPKAMFDAKDFFELDLLKAKWAEVENEQADFINSLKDESLEEAIAYVNTKGEEWKYPLSQMMQHVVNHSSYHRGQVTTMLRQLGAKAVPLDLLVFIDEKSKKS